MINVKNQLNHSENYFNFGMQFLHLFWASCQDLELVVALTDRKKAVFCQKKRVPISFCADHHFNPHKIGF